MKKVTVIIVFLALVLFLTGCVQKQGVEPIEQEFCVFLETGEKLSLTDAQDIALKSECVLEGVLKDTYLCNENTGTWWLDLNIVKEGCSPACVVNVVTKEANINWRCTGTIMEEQVTKLRVEILEKGTGDREVKPGDQIAVHYTGTLIDGTKFDSSLDRGVPFTFTIGQGQVIQGWDQGLLGMKVGEKRELTIPSDLAYGETGSGSIIPPNAVLIFEVELVSFAD